MNEEEEEEEMTLSAGELLLAIVIKIIEIPVFGFLVGFLAGGIIALVFPTPFLYGLGFLGITMTRIDIPMFCGAIGIIGRLLTTRV